MKQLLAAQICAWIVSHVSARRLRNYFDIACKLKFSVDANCLIYFRYFLGFLSPLKFARGRFPPRGGEVPYKSPWRIQGRGQGGPPPLFLYQTEARRTENHFLETRTPLISGSEWTGSPLIWRSGSIAQSDRDARRKIKIKSLWETNVGVAFEPKGDKAKTDVTTFFVTFFMCSPKRYLNGQIYWLSLPTTLCETKICNLHP